jgi:hypothetical protein
MLRMFPTGGTATQTWQIFEVPYVHQSMVAAGKGIAQLRGLFNSRSTAGANAYVLVRFCANMFDQTPYAQASLVLDGAAATWQNIKVQADIPIGTRWIIAEVGFQNNSLQGAFPDGYVDLVNFEFLRKP